MQLTANNNTLTAIRTLIDYLADDEREDYSQREQDERDNHIYETITQIEKWLSGPTQVLHMIAGSDDNTGLPQADCEILTAQEAAERLQEMLEGEHLPPLQYNPETDKVLVRHRTTDATGHHFYGFAPLADYTELTYDYTDIPLDRWQVIINDVVVYQEPEDEEDGGDEGTLVGDPENDEEDCTSSSYTASGCSGADGD